jgi:simple sugar transport system permease protein
MIWDMILSTLRLSVPILFAAYGGMFSERSGIANIALEACLMFAAFAAGAVTAMSGNLWLGVFAGVAASAAVAGLFAASCIWGRGDQIVIGTGFNLLAIGLIPVMCKALFSVTGSTPALSGAQTLHEVWPFVFAAVVMLFATDYLFRATRHGLRISAAGENPAALFTQGVDVKRLRLRAVIEGGVLTGIGGIYLSLCQGSGYVREMSAGRGFIALAALIFGGWRPLPTFLACLFFAFTDSVQMQLQGKQIGGVTVPNQFVQILPYVATLLVLTLHSRKIQAPSAINRNMVE